jgi:hypothetical protein
MPAYIGAGAAFTLAPYSASERTGQPVRPVSAAAPWNGGSQIR